ncbi:Flp family type IVb pilin [Frigoriglobus tundricola]|jgi:pilus assembly protein Flp/PilA|uniref:Flp pilus assembly protein, pilin Flp n=1 Tax=Frigoriglobus tundricola TaxID=2774151 RepID=A0A6M5YL76_9BACT|nr:Flp family type IVb pilin [Frigoriglobus tundricola]QJW92884.1 Flp pilus assembly protein, pilin Flp [Frigoriglobus tundricola]QJW94046.1 Flp pilus assembly protein, pilin Flp [Frigoriglobus tundricola]
MRSLTQKMVSFLKAEDGPTAVEYAVMLALIVVVCIAAITTLGQNANSTFSFVGSSIKPPSAS